MGNLPIALVQLVEIAKATTWGAKVLLLDEPTSAIPDREVERLYEVVRTLKQQGVAMLYTTHRMAEISELADHVVVLRDGQLVLDAPLDRHHAGRHRARDDRPRTRQPLSRDHRRPATRSA